MPLTAEEIAQKKSMMDYVAKETKNDNIPEKIIVTDKRNKQEAVPVEQTAPVIEEAAIDENLIYPTPNKIHKSIKKDIQYRKAQGLKSIEREAWFPHYI